jgi:ATP-dependent helicase IRC3
VPVKVWSLSQDVRDISSPAGIIRVQNCLVPPSDQRTRFHEGIAEELDQLAFEEIEKLAETEKFNKQVLQYYQAQAVGRRSTLVFSKDLNHVYNLVEVMADAGIQAKAVTHKMSDFERQNNIASFERGDTAVLINCLALSEGSDAPHVSLADAVKKYNHSRLQIDCIILARPTNSPTQHTQMVSALISSR